MNMREQMARAIKLCDVCDGEGTVCDGMDEAGCSMPCPVCFGTGDDVTAALNLIANPDDEMVERCARRLCEQHIRNVRRHDTEPDRLDATMAAAVEYSWSDYADQARACLEAAVGGE